MIRVHTEALSRALHSRPGEQQTTRFELHCCLESEALGGTAEPDGVEYRASYLVNRLVNGELAMTVTCIESNQGSQSAPHWFIDALPMAIRRALSELILKALREQEDIELCDLEPLPCAECGEDCGCSGDALTSRAVGIATQGEIA